MNYSRLSFLLLFTVLTLATLPSAFASAESDEYENDASYSLFCKATLPSDAIYPGSSVESVIACINVGGEMETKTAFLVAGYLQPPHSHNTIIQNFSVVRQGRPLRKGEATSFLYTFTPSSYLEADEYNLVLGVYARSDEDQKSVFLVAYNSTITVQQSNTDPQLIMTYITLLAILCGIVYGIGAKLGLFKSQKQKRAIKPSPVSSPASSSCDLSYVSKEHQRYREELLNKSASRVGSPDRKT